MLKIWCIAFSIVLENLKLALYSKSQSPEVHCGKLLQHLFGILITIFFPWSHTQEEKTSRSSLVHRSRCLDQFKIGNDYKDVSLHGVGHLDIFHVLRAVARLYDKSKKHLKPLKSKYKQLSKGWKLCNHDRHLKP